MRPVSGNLYTKNTLQREGIKPATSSTISGSKFGKAQSTPQKARAQQHIDNVLPDRKHPVPTGARRPSEIVDNGVPHLSFLSRSQWIGLGDGWYQTTPSGTGAITRCGLHSVIESSLAQFFMCLYEPRSKEAIAACTSSSPEYDLEIHAKMLSKVPNSGISAPSSSDRRSNRQQHFQVVFGFKSATEYCTLKCDEIMMCWQIIHITRGQEYIIRQIPDDNIKVNQFYPILIQIRGSFLSVDVNGTPIFTNIRLAEKDNLGGLMGLLSKGTKFAIKGWKLRGISSSISSNNSHSSSAIRSTEVMVESSTGIEVPVSATTPRTVFSGFNAKHNGSASHLLSNGGSSSPPSTPQKSMSLLDLLKTKNSGGAGGSTSGGVTFSHQKGIPNSGSDISNNGNSGFRSSKQQGTSVSSSYSVVSSSVLPVARVNGNSGRYDIDTEDIVGQVPTNRNQLPQQPQQGLEASNTADGSASSDSTDQMLASCTAALCETHDRSIVETVMRDVVQRDLGITFDDIASLDTAKRLLNEAIVLPLIMPEFFTGIREPWKGVLLFGPPGTGKTLLAKAVCSFNSSTFFSCSSSSLISKYRGESEKIVRCLFEAARLCAPSIVFLDEIDALVSSRGDNEHEASRRLKTEIFSQMDGLASTKSVNDATNKSVMVLATTNCPWDLDDALRRRLEKRIYIPLPDLQAREEIFRICLRNIPISLEVSISTLAQWSEGYSGSDVHTACKDAAMMPMRRLLSMLSPADIVEMKAKGNLLVPKVTLDDFRRAIANTKPSVASGTISRYEAWEREFSNR